MSPQPKALVLADALEELDVQFSHTGLCGEAADELRRLHEVNVELLETLENCIGNINPERGFADELEAEIRAAIAKARGEQ